MVVVELQCLILTGSKLNARDQYGCTALYFACKHGHPHVARLLISAGADLNIADTKGYTPLASKLLRFCGFSDYLQVFILLSDIFSLLSLV